MTTSDVPQVNWLKSSHSSAQGECVEVAATACVVLVRDSKRPDGEQLSMPSASWAQFVGSRS
jgi:hypothetical protein